jgi:hypothetical protein
MPPYIATHIPPCIPHHIPPYVVLLMDITITVPLTDRWGFPHLPQKLV